MGGILAPPRDTRRGGANCSLITTLMTFVLMHGATGLQESSSASPDAMQTRVALLEKTLAEMEETDRLRDRASAVLKEELAEMRRRETRGRVDLTYVKSVRRALRPSAVCTHAATSQWRVQLNTPWPRGVDSCVSFLHLGLNVFASRTHGIDRRGCCLSHPYPLTSGPTGSQKAPIN